MTLKVVTSGTASGAVAEFVPKLVADKVASRIAAKDFTLWGKDAENANKYLTKGRQVYVEGRLQTRKYEDKDGDTRYASEIVAETVRLLGSRGGDEGGSGGERQQSQRGEQRQQSSGGQRNGGGQRSGGQQSRKPEPEPHDNYIPDAPEDDIPF